MKKLLFSLLLPLVTSTAWADIAINETNFPDANFRNYLLNQTYGIDAALTDDELAKVTKLNLSNKEICSLQGIEFFTALTSLACFNNKLTSLDVSRNTELTGLYCQANQLTSLNVTKNTELTELRCFYNQLTSLEVSGCTAMEYLDCSLNSLTSLDVTNNTELAFLDCHSNNLNSLDVLKNTELTVLYCYNNHLTSLDVTKNTELTRLDCGKNLLTSLDVSKNTELTCLDCFLNKIRGAKMDAFVKSLPTVSNGEILVKCDKNEGNVMTPLQVAAAKAKGWNPVCFGTNENYTDYLGE